MVALKKEHVGVLEDWPEPFGLCPGGLSSKKKYACCCCFFCVLLGDLSQSFKHGTMGALPQSHTPLQFINLAQRVSPASDTARKRGLRQQ